jgi:hypothetical protein
MMGHFNLTRQDYNPETDEYDHVPIRVGLTQTQLETTLKTIPPERIYMYYVTEYGDVDAFGLRDILYQDSAECYVVDKMTEATI